MLKSRSSIPLLCAILLSACASQKETARTEKMAPPPAPLPAMRLNVDPISHRLDSLVAMSSGMLTAPPVDV